MRDTHLQLLSQLDPERGHAPWRSSADRIERVLHLHLITPEEPQTPLCRALESLAARDGYRRIDWTALPPADRHHRAVEAAAELRPTLIFMQLQRPGVLAAATVAQMRRAASTDDLVVISWCGDVGGSNGPNPDRNDRWAYELSGHCELMLYSSISQVQAHRSRGMRNAGYLQIGYDEDRYFEGESDDSQKRYDVVFLGVKYNAANWPSLPENDIGARQAAVEAMRREFGARFGLFGNSWGAGVSHLSPAQSGDVYRQAHLSLSISISSVLERYSSDRLFRALACGAPVLIKAFGDWRSFGLVHGDNAFIWEKVDEVLALARTWLSPERRGELREIGRRGARLCRDHHSWGVRMQELRPLISAVRGQRIEVVRPW